MIFLGRIIASEKRRTDSTLFTMSTFYTLIHVLTSALTPSSIAAGTILVLNNIIDNINPHPVVEKMQFFGVGADPNNCFGKMCFFLNHHKGHYCFFNILLDL